MTMAISQVVALHDGRIRLLRTTVRRHYGAVLTHHIEDHGGAAPMLPYDPERRVTLLVSQIRVPSYYAAQVESMLVHRRRRRHHVRVA